MVGTVPSLSLTQATFCGSESLNQRPLNWPSFWLAVLERAENGTAGSLQANCHDKGLNKRGDLKRVCFKSKDAKRIKLTRVFPTVQQGWRVPAGEKIREPVALPTSPKHRCSKRGPTHGEGFLAAFIQGLQDRASGALRQL